MDSSDTLLNQFSGSIECSYGCNCHAIWLDQFVIFWIDDENAGDLI